MANLQDNVTSVLTKALDSEPMKFVIVFLMFLVVCLIVLGLYDRRTLMKFLDKKLGSLETKVDDNVGKTAAMLDAHLKELKEFQDKLRDGAYSAREDILKTKYELLQQVELTKTQCAEVKAMVAEYGADNTSVVKAMAEYKNRMEALESNMNKFLEILKKRKESDA